MHQEELDFDKYPESPGWKKRSTAKEAADKTAARAPTLREQVLSVLQQGEYTADEVAEKLGKSILSIRPRLSELVAMDKIEETGKKRFNSSMHRAIVWRAR